MNIRAQGEIPAGEADHLDAASLSTPSSPFAASMSLTRTTSSLAENA